jgi:hypothetical protein
MPVAYFLGCAGLKKDTEANQEAVLVYINPVLRKYFEYTFIPARPLSHFA